MILLHPTAQICIVATIVFLILYYITRSRKTYVAANYHCAIATVDVAVVHLQQNNRRVLMGRKRGKTLWRFIGGFVDPDLDKSFCDAALRELREEAPGCVVKEPVRIADAKIEKDSRYKHDKDKLFTTFFVANYVDNGWIPTAGDDLEEVAWFDLDKLTSNKIIPDHWELLQKLNESLA